MPDPTDILILSASTGAGHVTAARALAQAFRTARPTVQVKTLDVLSISHRLFRMIYGGGYVGLVQYAPVAMGWLYDAMDTPNGRLREAVRLGIQNLYRRPTARYVAQCRPRLIVNTHFLPAEIVAQERRAGRVTCPQVTVTTDFETHRMWAQEPTERYYTATQRGKSYLMSWGVDAEKVRVTGIPLRPGFDASLCQEEARQRHGLDTDVPVVLLLCGAFGLGPARRLIESLLASSRALQLVVIAGRDESLRRGLEPVAARARPPVRVRLVGFTDQMHEWMRAADLAVSKAGGLTASEALACRLPLIIMNPIPGQETRNSDYLLEKGVAVKVNHPRLLAYRVGRLLQDSERLAAMRAAAGAIGHPDAAQRIATDALELLVDAAV